MGLDMHLDKRHGFWEYAGGKVEQVVSTDNTVRPERIKYIIEEVMYWRKANQIHRWFVEHIQDGDDNCREYEVDKSQLVELLAAVEEVLADHSKAEELLPTQEGFFFGGTEYDDDYFGDLDSTAKVLREELGVDAIVSAHVDYLYHSSW